VLRGESPACTACGCDGKKTTCVACSMHFDAVLLLLLGDRNVWDRSRGIRPVAAKGCAELDIVKTHQIGGAAAE
jgi:hypothetical protein